MRQAIAFAAKLRWMRSSIWAAPRRPTHWHVSAAWIALCQFVNKQSSVWRLSTFHRRPARLRHCCGNHRKMDRISTRCLRRFCGTRAGPKDWREGPKKDKPHADTAKIGLRVLVELGVPAATLTAVLRSAAGQEGRKRTLDAAETKRLLALAQTQGDPSRGEAIFRRPSLGCFQC